MAKIPFTNIHVYRSSTVQQAEQQQAVVAPDGGGNGLGNAPNAPQTPRRRQVLGLTFGPALRRANAGADLTPRIDHQAQPGAFAAIGGDLGGNGSMGMAVDTVFDTVLQNAEGQPQQRTQNYDRNEALRELQQRQQRQVEMTAWQQAQARERITRLKSFGLTKAQEDVVDRSWLLAPKLPWIDIAGHLNWNDLKNLRSTNQYFNAIGLALTKGLIVTDPRKLGDVTDPNNPKPGDALKYFSGQFGDRKLLKLELRGNGFTDAHLQLVPDTVQELRLIDADQITQGAVVQLATRIPHLKSLTHNGCSFDIVDDRVFMAAFQHLETVWLDGRHVTDADLLLIPRTARRVKLTGTRGVTPDGLRRLGEHLPHLRSLIASDCHFGPDHARAIAGFAELDMLDLTRNDLGDEGVRAIGNHASITSLWIGNNGLTWHSAEVLSHNANIRKLLIHDNDLGVRGMQHLSQMPGLEDLDASNCNIGNLGVNPLAANQRITTIHLDDNAIGPPGAARLAQSRIAHFSLDRNPIGDAGAQSLAGSPWIQSLRARRAGIRNAGATALSLNTNLDKLDLLNNPFGAAGRAALASVRGRMTELRY